MALRRSDLNKILNAFKSEDETLESSTKALLDLFHGEIDSEKDKYDDLEKQFEEYKKTADADSEWKQKYEKEHDSFENFKKEQLEAAEKETKSNLFKSLLKEEGISEKYLDIAYRASDLTKVVIKDGKIENADDLKATIKNDFAAFIAGTDTKGAEVPTPPVNDGKAPTDLGSLSMADYIAARQKKG